MIDETEKAITRSLLEKQQEEQRKELNSGPILSLAASALLIRVEQLERIVLELRFKQSELEGRDWPK